MSPRFVKDAFNITFSERATTMQCSRFTRNTSPVTVEGLELGNSCIRWVKRHTYLKKTAAENCIPEILSFNIFIGDLFFIVSNIDFVRYDDNTLYIADTRIQEVIKTLTYTFAELFCCFVSNQMKPNHVKRHLLISSNKELSRKNGRKNDIKTFNGYSS